MRPFVLLCFLVAAHIAAAQTCTGGLGAPIVNVTFGQGYDFGPELPAGTTTLTFVQNFCPSDGQYTIVSYSPACFGATWLPLGEDHTGNQTGKYMLINASYQPDDFYVQKVNGLCPGTSYQFSAWVVNMNTYPGLILPNITFRIEGLDGTVLASFSTGDVAHHNPLVWVQYAFYFTLPAGVSNVVLRMTNNAPGGNGNDFALDDITFRAAGPTIQLTAEGFPTDTISICDYNQQVTKLDATVGSCYVNEQTQWQMSTDSGKNWQDIPGANGLSYSRRPTGAGLYLYRLVVAQTGNLGTVNCEVFSNPISISVVPKPDAEVSIAGSLSTVCIGLPVTFTATSKDGGTGPQYQWFVNGLPVGQDSTGFTVLGLLNGDAVRCVMTSDAVCVVQPQVSSNTLSLPVAPVPVQAVSIDASATAVCQDSLVKFVAVPDNGGANPAYQWQVNGVNGGVGRVFNDSQLNDGDVVNCIMTGSLVCSQPVNAASTIKMTVYPLPVIKLDSVVIIAGGASVRLDAVVTGDVVRYSWSPTVGLDDPSVVSPVADPTGTTSYQLYVVTRDGCHSAATELVEVYYPLRMPAAFTPNGDGRNDVFRVPAVYPVQVQYLAVFNRMGGRVFFTTNSGTGWDGRFNGVAQPAGTYVWELVFENPITKKAEERRGTVVLVR
jgi:gliding motility-associated-like protein